MRTLLLTLALLSLLPLTAAAQAVTVKQSTCTVTWGQPTTNADGTKLTDLKEYGVYVGANATVLTAPFVTVAAASAAPAVGSTAAWPCKTLAPGSYVVQIDAVDTSGNRSGRSPVVPFVLIPDPDVVPPSAPGAPVVAGP